MLASILLALLLFYSSIRGEDLLSKFHQSTYKLKDSRAEIVSYDESYLSKFNIITFKYNRTRAITNITATLKKDVLAKNLIVLVQAYKFASNEYRRFPVRFQETADKFLTANVLGVQSWLSRCGNVSTELNFSKGVTYHLCNIIADASLLPPLIPTGIYKVEVDGLYPVNKIAKVAIYFEIYIPFNYDNM